jgi:hypothetical protein
LLTDSNPSTRGVDPIADLTNQINVQTEHHDGDLELDRSNDEPNIVGPTSMSPPAFSRR